MGNQSSQSNCAAQLAAPVQLVGGMTAEVRAMHIAVMKNDTEMLQQVILMGVDVNEPWENADNPSVKDGSTAINQAVALNHSPCVRVLLQSGASHSKKDKFGFTPLHKAAYHGRKDIVEILIAADADVDEEDLRKNSPLSICVQNGMLHHKDYIESVKTLISLGAQVNKPNAQGRIPLHFAVLFGLRDIVVILLKYGSDINFLDRQRETPLYTCIKEADMCTWKHQRVSAALSALQVIICSGGDTLNLSLWLRNNSIPQKLSAAKANEDFLVWYEANIPVQLKDLCRIFIQKRLWQRGELTKLVKLLPVPKLLKEFLIRKPLSSNVAPNY